MGTLGVKQKGGDTLGGVMVRHSLLRAALLCGAAD